MILCEFDSCFFIRQDEETWISKSWALRGPTGCMMNKVVPAQYSKNLEKVYNESLKDPTSRNNEMKVIGRVSDSSLDKNMPIRDIKVEDSEPKESKTKVTRNKKLSPSKDYEVTSELRSVIKKEASDYRKVKKMDDGFNPLRGS